MGMRLLKYEVQSSDELEEVFRLKEGLDLEAHSQASFEFTSVF